MRVPGFEDPIQLSSEDQLADETKLIENFRDLPPYTPLRLVDMDPEDPNYATEITRQLLVQGKAGTLNQFTFNPSNIFKIRLGEGLQRRENWTLFPERGKSGTIRNDEEDSRDVVPGPQEEAV